MFASIAFEAQHGMVEDLLDQAEEALISFQPAAIDKLQASAQAISQLFAHSPENVAYAMSQGQYGRLLERCSVLRKLLDHSGANLALLQRISSCTDPSTAYSYAGRFYPWQH